VRAAGSGVAASEQRLERDRITHRLEAFSDIVIGFSLAQLGLSLVLPPHAADLVQHPFGIAAFLVTFFVVSRFWWTHFNIFEHYFEPTRLMMFFNFAALAGLTLQVFSLQAFVHFVPRGEGLTAARIYFGLFVMSYGMLCAMLALGVWKRWNALDPDLRRTGVRRAIGMACTVAGCALGDIFVTGEVFNVVVSAGTSTTLVGVFPQSIVTDMFAGWVVGIIASRLGPMLPNLVRKAIRARKEKADA
jgi:Endosomal/lysosomal potassium channel TMEM175